jgi:hypothetical protein
MNACRHIAQRLGEANQTKRVAETRIRYRVLVPLMILSFLLITNSE